MFPMQGFLPRSLAAQAGQALLQLERGTKGSGGSFSSDPHPCKATVLPHLEVTVMEDTLKNLHTYLYTYLYSCYKSIEVFFFMAFCFSRFSSSY